MEDNIILDIFNEYNEYFPRKSKVILSAVSKTIKTFILINCEYCNCNYNCKLNCRCKCEVCNSKICF